ncbi:MAG: hypothetical protein K6U74_08150 [Firmicutes bacterium]|nr:hypothetical protein [Bacillota bacterium]
MERARMPVVILILICLFLIPLFTRDEFLLNILILAHIYAIYVLGWDFLAGISGQISGGHALSFGSAAYISAFLCLAGCIPLAAMLLSVLAVSLLGLLIGHICREQSGAYLIIVTLAMAEIAHEFSLNIGIKNPDGYIMGGEGGIPVNTVLVKGSPYFYQSNYYVTLIALLLCVFFLTCLVRSVIACR